MPRHLILPVLLGLTLAACAGGGEGPPIAQQPVPPSVDWSQAQDLDVFMTDFDYSPKALELVQDQPYRLHFINRGSGGHDFTARDFFAAAAILQEDQTAVADGRVNLKKEQRQDVRLVPLTPGNYDVYCSHFLHKTFGMTGRVVVRPREMKGS